MTDLFYGKSTDGNVVYGTLHTRRNGRMYILNPGQTEWTLVPPETVHRVRDIPMESISVGSHSRVTFLVTPGWLLSAQDFLAECKAQRKEILDAGKDLPGPGSPCPTLEDLLEDVYFQGFDADGCYYDSFGITEHFSSGPFGCYGFEEKNHCRLFAGNEETLYKASRRLVKEGGFYR